jgi:PhzF family phenazine biosynthesis protein
VLSKRIEEDPTMKLRIFQVDAFAERPFEGNPAAVVPLEAWLADDVMQAIALENNLAETAFFVPEGEGLALRWFTPTVEVPLCGHATLASSHVIFSHLGWKHEAIVFQTKSGALNVRRLANGLLEMDFPSRPGTAAATPADLTAALGAAPQLFIDSGLPLAVFAKPQQIASLSPDFRSLAAFSAARGDGGLCCTAPADGVNGWDFVSRFFAPAHGIDEDPVTGGAHCALTPYWSKRLGKTQLVGRQISARGGTVLCEDRGVRVGLSGRCADYLVGEITV